MPVLTTRIVLTHPELVRAEPPQCKELEEKLDLPLCPTPISAVNVNPAGVSHSLYAPSGLASVPVMRTESKTSKLPCVRDFVIAPLVTTTSSSTVSRALPSSALPPCPSNPPQRFAPSGCNAARSTPDTPRCALPGASLRFAGTNGWWPPDHLQIASEAPNPGCSLA